ncbi:MAG TPA: hypothetical protein VMG09_15775, partial [Bacteroidota bacterium]|nr:hypothetical protein [Bacteroidota bacterium]
PGVTQPAAKMKITSTSIDERILPPSHCTTIKHQGRSECSGPGLASPLKNTAAGPDFPCVPDGVSM